MILSAVKRARSFFLIVALGSCTRQETGTSIEVEKAVDARDRGLVQIRGPDGVKRYGRRIDGSIEEVLIVALTSAEPQVAVLTGIASGRDQGKMMVFSDRAELLAEYRVSGKTPFPQHPLMARGPGEVRRQRQTPVLDQTTPFMFAGRRFVLLGTRGPWFPSAVVLLEATDRTTLEERMEFWNVGSVHFLQIHGKYVVMAGRNNSLYDKAWSGALAIFDLEEILARKQIKGRAPNDATPRRPPAAVPYRMYFRLPTDGGYMNNWHSLRLDGDTLSARVESGLRYDVDLGSGNVTLEAEGLYAKEYEQRRKEDSSLPPLNDRLAGLKNAVSAWVR